ncbi:hypothetical protein PM082_019411 [Marasmius tenuissimus]|nr:hypothetical protein PM082_019411 [Marasmius tenuissimus]
MNPQAHPTYHGSAALIPLFITIHTFVWIGSGIITLTAALSPTIRRHPTWFNLKLSWILACFSFSLLSTTGQLYKPEPVFWICVVQAAAVYSVPFLTAGSSLALAIYLYLVVRGRENESGGGGGRWKDHVVLLVYVPYILPSIAFFSVLSMGLVDPTNIGLSNNWMVCSIHRYEALGHASNICILAILIPTIIIECITLTSVYRHKRGRTVLLPTGTLIRLSVFTVFGVFGTVISFCFTRLTSPYQTALGNVLASVRESKSRSLDISLFFFLCVCSHRWLAPLSFIFLFGLQKDIVEAWTFWRRKTSASGPSLVGMDSETRI